MSELETFIPLMKPSKGFKILKEEIIDQGLCSKCGNCASLCDRVEMKDEGPELVGDCNIETGATKCSEDGTCYDSCPQHPFVRVEMDEKVYGKAREDPDLGVYKKIVAGRATKENILENAQDGGAVTAILAAALESGLIGSVSTASRDEMWKTEAEISKNPDEMAKNAGTKYAQTYTPVKLGDELRHSRRMGMVGTGCQTMGTRKSLMGALKKAIEKTKEAEVPIDVSLVGLFCFENFPYACLKEMVEKEFGVKMEDIKKTDITKGKFIVTTKDGNSKDAPVKAFDDCVPDSCKLCTNFTAEYADVAVGSIGSPEGWSTVIIRNDKGEKLVNNAVEKGYLELKDEINTEAIKKNQALKVKIRGFATKGREKAGKYVPKWE